MNKNEIVVSSRVRLARNLRGLPFPNSMTAPQIEELIERVNNAINRNQDFRLVRMRELPALQRQVLVERHLISPDLAKQDFGAALINNEETLSILVGEEDHIRIQCILPGLDLAKADEMTAALDRILASSLPYAFDEELGYLTACPTNVGTGMRASVMLHLPALSLAGQTNALLDAISKLGYAVRGFYGEGSKAPAHLYQISNQMTLGMLEEDILANLNTTVQRIIDRETEVREALKKSNELELKDIVFRSLGTLQHAYKLDTQECMEHLSNIKLGIALDWITDFSQQEVNHLITQVQSASLQQARQHVLSSKDRDAARAEVVRAAFSKKQ